MFANHDGSLVCGNSFWNLCAILSTNMEASGTNVTITII